MKALKQILLFVLVSLFLFSVVACTTAVEDPNASNSDTEIVSITDSDETTDETSNEDNSKEETSDKTSEENSDKTSEENSDTNSEEVSDKTSEGISDETSEEVSDKTSEETSEDNSGTNPEGPVKVLVDFSIVFADGEVWTDQVYVDKGISILTYMKSWGLTPEEIQDVDTVTVNKETQSLDYVFTQDCGVRIVFKNVTTEDPAGEVRVNFTVIFADGKTSSSEIFMPKGYSVYTLVKTVCTADSWEAILNDIHVVTVNNQEVDVNYSITERADVVIKLSTIVSEPVGSYQYYYKLFVDGKEDLSGKVNLPQEEVTLQLLYIAYIGKIIGYEYTDLTFNNENNELLSAASKIKSGSTLYMYYNKTQTSIDVKLIIFDAEGLQSDTKVVLQEATLLESFLKQNVNDQALRYLVKVLVDDVEVPYSFIIEKQCVVTLYFKEMDIPTPTEAITLTFINAQGDVVNRVECHNDAVKTLMDLLNVLGVNYEEYSALGYFASDKEPLMDLNSKVSAGDSVYFYYNPENFVYLEGAQYTIQPGVSLGEFLLSVDRTFDGFVWFVNGEQQDYNYTLKNKDEITFTQTDMGGFNVYFNDDFFFVEKGTTLQIFVENVLYKNWEESIKEGYWVVGDVVRADANTQLYSEVVVSYVLEKVECSHVWDNGYCYLCNTHCAHEGVEPGSICNNCNCFVAKTIEFALCMYSINSEGYEGFYFNYYTYVVDQYNQNNANEIISKSAGISMTENSPEGYPYIWSRGGQSLDPNAELNHGDVIIASQIANEFKPFTATLTIEGGKTASYEYSLPISYQEVKNRFFNEVGEDASNYYEEFGKFDSSISHEVIASSVTVTYKLQEVYAYLRVTNENGTGDWQEFKYTALTYPTVKELIEKAGLKAEDYFVLNYNDVLEDLNVKNYSRLFLVKKSLVTKAFTVKISQNDGYGNVVNASTQLSTPITLEGLLMGGIKNENGEFISFYYDPYNYIYKINGVALADSEENKMDNAYYMIYSDVEIEIVPAYRVNVSLYNGESKQIVSENPLTASELLERLNIENLDKYVILLDGWTDITKEFYGRTYPMEGNRDCNIEFRPGLVSVTLMMTTGDGSWQYPLPNQEFNMSVSLNEILSSFPEDKENYTWKIFMPNGNYLDVTDFNVVLEYLPEYSEQMGANSYYTKYEIYATNKYFVVTLTIDDQYIGEKTFAISDNYSFAQILSQFGDYSYDSYNWNFSTNNGEWVSADTIVTFNVSAYGYDNRPYLTVTVDKESYKIYHTTAMTLLDAINAVNQLYGTNFTFEAYIWKAIEVKDFVIDPKFEQVTDPNVLVIEAGYSREVIASTLKEVKVNFYSTFGFIEGAYDEYGNSLFKYNRDSAWTYPQVPVDEGMTYGFVEFKGEWEYVYKNSETGEETRTVISSVEQLFALNKEEVNLEAKFEVVYEKIYGKYFDGSTVLCLSEKTLTYYNIYDNVVYEYEYTVEIEYSRIQIVTNERTFDVYMLLPENKIEQNEVLIFVVNQYGDVNYYTTVEDYNGYLENCKVSYIKKISGEVVESITLGDIYFSYVEVF